MKIRVDTRVTSRAAAAAVAACAVAGPVTAFEATLRVPADYPTITAAMEAAGPWDEVVVAPGVYAERVTVKDGVVLRSERGPGETTLTYGTVSSSDQGEAVVTLSRCTNSTQLVGFSIDGQDLAKRGILVFGDGSPVISGCRIFGALNGIGAHRNASPYITDTVVERCTIAGILVQGASGDIRDCELRAGKQFGLIVEGTTKPLMVRRTAIRENEQAGVRATEGDFSIVGGSVSANGNTGIILEYVSPVLEGVLVDGNKNIGVSMENSTGTLLSCTIRNNNFGVIIRGAGDPKVFRNVFEDNATYHIGVQGAVVPVIGGSMENANLFLGQTIAAIQTECPVPINATYNYWGKPCATRDQVKRLAGAKDVVRKPWVTVDLRHAFESCEEAKEHSRQGAAPDAAAAPAPTEGEESTT
jgi:parallel beta-helix repeat protein